MSEAILRLLHERGEMTARQIAEATGRPIHGTLDSLRRLHKKHTVFQPRKLVWAIVTPSEFETQQTKITEEEVDANS